MESLSSYCIVAGWCHAVICERLLVWLPLIFLMNERLSVITVKLSLELIPVPNDGRLSNNNNYHLKIVIDLNTDVLYSE